MEQFAQIVHEYSPRLVGLATRIVGSREAAEDVVQDALVKAFQRRESWRGEGQLSTWLYAIVYRQAISSIRGKKRLGIMKELPETASDDAWEEEIDLTDENIAKMRRALEQLPEVDRALVGLFHIEDKSVRECAAVCGLSEANVKVRLHRARGKLKELMGRNDDGSN